jgi:hypothetical protein
MESLPSPLRVLRGGFLFTPQTDKENNMAWATPDDIKNLWHSAKVLPTDMKLANFIDSVEGQVRNEYGTQVQVWIDSNELDLKFVKDTVAWIVIDYLQTDGKPYSSESQSYSGAASRSVSYNDTARTSLRLNGSDLAMFKPKNRTQQGNIFSVSMAPRLRSAGPVSDYYANSWRLESAPGNADGGL